MRQILQQFALLLFFSTLVLGQQDAVNDVFLSFDTDAIMDDTTVIVGIGRPVQTYRLRLVFAPSLFNTSGAIGHITLYNSDRLRLSSATYENVIPGRVGRDIVEIGSVRWVALIDTRPTAWRDAPLSIMGSISYIPDGLFYLGDIEAPAPGSYWKAAHIDRLGITWTRTTSELIHHRQAGRTRSQQLDYREQTSLDGKVVSIGSSAAAHVPGYGGPLRLVISPDSHVTLVPAQLFAWYFKNKNLYSNAPITWEPLRILCADGLAIHIKGTSILPLRDDQFINDQATEVNRFLRILVTAVAEYDPSMATTDMVRWLVTDYKLEPWAAHQLIGAVGKYDVVTVAGSMALKVPKKYVATK